MACQNKQHFLRPEFYHVPCSSLHSKYSTQQEKSIFYTKTISKKQVVQPYRYKKESDGITDIIQGCSAALKMPPINVLLFINKLKQVLYDVFNFCL